MDERTSDTSAGHRADAAGRGRRTRGQRNFLGIYDLMLKTLQLDYASCARYEASGYSEFIGQLYTLNSGMFQSSRYCDRTLTQMILHYLTWFQDPGLQLLVGPGAAWRVSQDFGTQRYGDALYVTWARPGAQVAKGEAIVAINGQALEEIRPEVERTLWTTAEPVDHEREDWSVVLAFARHVTVRGADGGERVVKLASYEGVPGTGASDEGSGAQSALAQGVDLPACELVRQGEVGSPDAATPHRRGLCRRAGRPSRGGPRGTAAGHRRARRARRWAAGRLPPGRPGACPRAGGDSRGALRPGRRRHELHAPQRGRTHRRARGATCAGGVR